MSSHLHNHTDYTGQVGSKAWALAATVEVDVGHNGSSHLSPQSGERVAAPLTCAVCSTYLGLGSWRRN